MNPAKMQPALLGGVAIGVLSALPIVNIGNLCCCAWVVFGGALAAYLMQQNHPAPINAGDGAVVGLMAGAIGAVVGSILAIPVSMALGPFQAQILENVLQGSRDLPAEVAIDLRTDAGRPGRRRDDRRGVHLQPVLLTVLLFDLRHARWPALARPCSERTCRRPPPPVDTGFTPPTFTPPSTNFPPPPPPPPPPLGS